MAGSNLNQSILTWFLVKWFYGNNGMAATKRNAMNIEEARKKIQTTQLVNRLQDHALGKIDLSQTQVRALEILLRKSIYPIFQPSP